MLFVTTNPRGPSTTTDWQGTCEIVEAAARVDRARRELSEAEQAETDAREKAAARVQQCGGS